jgi:hypothetical protein
MKPRVTAFAPQFLVGDLARSIAYYQKLGFIGEHELRRPLRWNRVRTLH